MRHLIALGLIVMVFTGCSSPTGKELREHIDTCTTLELGVYAPRNVWGTVVDTQCCVPGSRGCNAENLKKEKVTPLKG